MANHEPIGERRGALVRRMLPEGVPSVWCPPLTHYDADGLLDRQRIAAHLRSISPYVKGLLVPGSTGDGWEMTDDEQRELMDHVLDVASQLGLRVLIGALRPGADEARRVMVETLEWLHARTERDSPAEAMVAAGVCGFTVCPPKGENLSQVEISNALEAILEMGVPTALYQLPQVTLNEMSPQTVAELAGRHASFYLLKDTSGRDAVAQSGLDFAGVYLVRGAEGDYHRWLKSAGGPYAGFLLSTANCFGERFCRMIELLDAGRAEEAERLIAPVNEVVARVFDLVAELPEGNPFANANKAIDHYLAHGAEAIGTPPPRLHAGSSLPPEVVAETGRALRECGLMPVAGYLGAG